MRIPWGVLVALAGAALVAGGIRRPEIDADPGEPPDMPTTGKAAPIAVGQPSDPAVAPLLLELKQRFADAGIVHFTPREVFTMRKAPGAPLAIPPRPYWDRMVRTLRDVAEPLRVELGRPITIYNGYRPPDYNAAVGGKPGSRHQWAEAIDMYPASGGATARRELALLAANLYRSGAVPSMGLGVYGTSSPSVHVDAGYKRRSWADAQHWIDRAAVA